MLDSQPLVAAGPITHTQEGQVVPWAAVPAVLSSQLLLGCGYTCGAELIHNFTLQSCERSKGISNPIIWFGFALHVLWHI